MRKFLLALLLLSQVAYADYSIKTSTGTDILLKSNIINGVHVPVMSTVETVKPSTFTIEIEPLFETETVTDLTGSSPVTIDPPYSDPTLLKFSAVGGMTSINGYWHSEDGETVPAIANSAYTSGGEYQAITVEEITRDIITNQVVLQLTDTGTASLYGASNTAGMSVYAYNPIWPGERIILIDYQNPNSIYEKGGQINSITLNSVLYQTYAVPVTKYIPAGWFIAFEPSVDFGLTSHAVKIMGQYGTSPLVIDGPDMSNILVTPIINTGTNLLVNGDFTDWTGNEPDDWTVTDATGFDEDVATFMADPLGNISQNVTLVEGSTYALQITSRGSSLYFSNLLQIGATSRSIDIQTESFRFVASSTNYTIAIFFPRANTYYEIESVELIEVN